jgi:dTMP kinase
MTGRGALISFEGSEGCGKSTQIRLLRARLERAGRPVELLREPGGTAAGEAIRHLLQHSQDGAGMAPECELLLFAASRAQLVRERIRPLLDSGVTVLLDRFLDSTTVYQGLAGGLPEEAVSAINAFATGGTVPDATLLMDMDAATARARITATGRPLDRIESQAPEFFEKVRAGYLALARREPARIHVLDATLAAEDIHETVWTIVSPLCHAV